VRVLIKSGGGWACASCSLLQCDLNIPFSDRIFKPSPLALLVSSRTALPETRRFPRRRRRRSTAGAVAPHPGARSWRGATPGLPGVSLTKSVDDLGDESKRARRLPARPRGRLDSVTRAARTPAATMGAVAGLAALREPTGRSREAARRRGRSRAGGPAGRATGDVPRRRCAGARHGPPVSVVEAIGAKSKRQPTSERGLLDSRVTSCPPSRCRDYLSEPGRRAGPAALLSAVRPGVPAAPLRRSSPPLYLIGISSNCSFTEFLDTSNT
jgi:hypothetical protein